MAKQLMDVLKFTVTDIAINHNGYISPSQKLGLQNSLKWEIILKYSIILIPAIAYGLSNINDLSDSISITLNTALGIVVPIGISTALIGIIVRRVRKIDDDLLSGKVKSITGKVILETRLGHTLRYRLIIEDVEFKISESLHEAFNNNADYCIHYIPSSKTILSAVKL